MIYQLTIKKRGVLSMVSIGADMLLHEYKSSPLLIAEALLRGEIKPHQEKYVDEVVSMLILEAAKFRVANDFATTNGPSDKTED